MISSFFEIWDTVLASIEGKVITANAVALPVPTEFFNKQPLLKNSEVDVKYPKMIVRFFSPMESTDLKINEKLICEVVVDARAPYIEGVKAPTIVINNNETLILQRGIENPPGIEEQSLQTVTFLSTDFASPPNATPTEIQTVLAAQLTGVTVTVEPNDTVRILHDTLGAFNTLFVTGGTATALTATFPTTIIAGRDAGIEVQRRDPPLFYNMLIHVTHQAARFDHHSDLVLITEKLFRLLGTPNLRSITIGGDDFEITRGPPVDDPLVSEGVFISIVPYTLRNVPVDLDADFWAQDNFNGGNSVQTDCGPLQQGPKVEIFELNFTPVAPEEPL